MSTLLRRGTRLRCAGNEKTILMLKRRSRIGAAKYPAENSRCPNLIRLPEPNTCAIVALLSVAGSARFSFF